VRAVVRATHRFRQSAIVEDITMYRDLTRIDFRCSAHWQERQVLLKVAFPVEVRSDTAAYEIQFGAIRRPTHRNTSWDEEKFEVAAHRWADLSEAGYGVSLLSDCKYGYDVRDNVLRVSLLRGPEWPDPSCDQGEHRFTYALYPHSGDWIAGETVRRAQELSSRLRCRICLGGSAATGGRCYYAVDGPAILQTVKCAEDGRGVILRFYEPNGGRGRVRARLPGPVKSVRRCNLVEEDGPVLDSTDSEFEFEITPFGIRTFRVELSASGR
jgi:alpha-mannosidase